MKTPVIAATVLTLLAAAAHAQQAAPPSSNPNAQPPAQTRNVAPTQETKGPWHMSDFMSSRVYNMAGERIGDVNDIIVDDSGKVTAVIIGVGGFLGIGEKQVSMELEQAKRMVHSDGKSYFTVNTTKEQLQSAPAYTKPKAS